MAMKPVSWILAVILALAGGAAASAADRVEFAGADGTRLPAWFYAPSGATPPYPAIVFLHGCSGIGIGGGISATYGAWARHLNEAGYAVLAFDSARPRGFSTTCGLRQARRTMLRTRPADAYGALTYLQARADIAPDRIGLMGWSQGGGIVLLSVNTASIGRPTPAPGHDFKAAVALYPATCSKTLQSKPFTSVEPGTWATIAPLLVLHGARDNWTPAGPCRAFIAGVAGRGGPAAIKAYRDAAHSFDAPNLKLRRRSGPRLKDGSTPLIGTHAAARADAMRIVPEFFARSLK